MGKKINGSWHGQGRQHLRQMLCVVARFVPLAWSRCDGAAPGPERGWDPSDQQPAPLQSSFSSCVPTPSTCSTSNVDTSYLDQGTSLLDLPGQEQKKPGEDRAPH